MKFKFSAIAFLFVSILSAQTTFVRKDSIPAFLSSQQLKYAWTGGMNYIQYSEIDLNQDGIMDLFLFDRSGNKITTFINLGTPNQVSYVPAMEYVPKFPKMSDWVLLRDYNCDGKMDIFTCNASKVKVFKNISTVATGLQFQLVTQNILANLTPNSTNNIAPLNVSFIDIPAIRDVDGDGDLDVLNFGLNGLQVEYYKNTSIENFGTCDSLKYVLTSICWGEFTESQLDATITLNTPCLPPPAQNEDDVLFHNANLHAGSCLECLNIDNDNDQDLLVGDMTNPYINLIRNNGTSSYAIADSIDALFPNYDTTMEVQIFGCAFHLDVDNDGKKDLLFSPDALNTAENFRSSLYYHNTNTNADVRVHYIQNNFLQDNMIEVGEAAYPTFFDYDNDGDQDLFIGNKGYSDLSGLPLCMIALWENTGTATNPIFTHKSSDFSGIYTGGTLISGIYPTFGDLDGDGDKDLIVGDVNGQLHYFQKNPGNDTNFVLVSSNFMGIDVGSFASPQLVDVDRDGKLDLLIGEQTGNVNYFHNNGTTTVPSFTSTPTNLLFGNVIVTQAGFTTGYSTPCMYDSSGYHILFVGSERGFLFRFDNIDGNLSGTFTLTDSLYVSHYEGGRIAASVADLNADGKMDVVIGNLAGGASLFFGDNTVSIEELAPSISFNLFPNPASYQIVIETNAAPTQKQFFTIYDLSGKEIHREEIFQQRTNVNVNFLSNGVYICSMRDENGFCVNRKLVIGDW